MITDECREAYNSLVEKPAATLHRFNYDMDNLKNSLQLSTSMSALQVPANKSTAIEEREHASLNAADVLSLVKPIMQTCKKFF